MTQRDHRDAGEMIPPAPLADSGPLEEWVYPTGDGAGELAATAGNAAESKRERIMRLLTYSRSYGYLVAPNQFQLHPTATAAQMKAAIHFIVCESCALRDYVCGERCTVNDFAAALTELLTGIGTRYSTEPTLATQPTDAGQHSRGCGGDHLPRNPASGDQR